VSHGGHDRTAVPVGSIVRFLIGLAVGCALAVLILQGMLRVFSSTESLAPLTDWGTRRVTPAGPVIRPVPVVERLDYERAEQERLSTYGWSDRKAGKVRIPIDEAMRAVVKRSKAGDALDFQNATPAKEKKR
jgi:hypothetical protein